jgi:hypothetical protein
MGDPLSKHHLVAVDWDDAHCIPSVEYAMDELMQVHHPRRFRAFGLLLKDDEAGVTLAGEEGAEGGIRTLNFIPRQMIQRVIDLGQPRVPSKARRRAGRPTPDAAPPTPVET